MGLLIPLSCCGKMCIKLLTNVQQIVTFSFSPVYLLTPFPQPIWLVDCLLPLLPVLRSITRTLLIILWYTSAGFRHPCQGIPCSFLQKYVAKPTRIFTSVASPSPKGRVYLLIKLLLIPGPFPLMFCEFYLHMQLILLSRFSSCTIYLLFTYPYIFTYRL